MQKYAKAWASLGITVLTLILGVLDGGITVAEWLTIGGAFAATIAVVGLPNRPDSPAVKAVAQAVVPVLGALAAALLTPEGVTAQVLIMAAIASAGTLGVYSVRNKGDEYDLAS